jgi:hypothetical protein
VRPGRDLQGLDELDEEERRRRPPAVHRVAFDDLVTPGPRRRVDGYALVPIESLRPGDEQVFAARFPRRVGEPVLDLDPLAADPSVRSIVASTTVRARRPLPGLEELLLLDRTFVPDAQTLRSLSGLARFWAGWAPSDRRLDAGALPVSLRELGISRAALSSGPGELAGLTGLSHLCLDGCLPKDSLQPLAGLTGLARLRADAPGGWSALGALTALEEVLAVKPRLANLRALRTWTRLRRLTLTGSGVRGLAGIEAFTALERLRLVMMGVDDLSPLAGLPWLGEVELTGLDRAHDLSPLGTLPSLRRLLIERAGIEERDIVHVDSLRPLASARALEAVMLRATVVDDGDLAPLAELPALRRVEVFGDLGRAVAALRRARPDVEVVWREGAKPVPGVQAGPVFLHPANQKIPIWWMREDLTGLLRAPTNADAEDRLRAALAVEDAPLLARLRFDTEADAVVVESDREEDLRAVARLIEQLSRPTPGTRRA